MTQEMVISFAMSSIKTAILLSAPLLLAGMVVGLLVSIFQAVTQINEQTLTFIPKILAISVALIYFAPWMLDLITTYTKDLIVNIPLVIR